MNFEERCVVKMKTNDGLVRKVLKDSDGDTLHCTQPFEFSRPNGSLPTYLVRRRSMHFDRLLSSTLPQITSENVTEAPKLKMLNQDMLYTVFCFCDIRTKLACKIVSHNFYNVINMFPSVGIVSEFARLARANSPGTIWQQLGLWMAAEALLYQRVELANLVNKELPSCITADDDDGDDDDEEYDDNGEEEVDLSSEKQQLLREALNLVESGRVRVLHKLEMIGVQSGGVRSAIELTTQNGKKIRIKCGFEVGYNDREDSHDMYVALSLDEQGTDPELRERIVPSPTSVPEDATLGRRRRGPPRQLTGTSNHSYLVKYIQYRGEMFFRNRGLAVIREELGLTAAAWSPRYFRMFLLLLACPFAAMASVALVAPVEEQDGVDFGSFQEGWDSSMKDVPDDALEIITKISTADMIERIHKEAPDQLNDALYFILGQINRSMNQTPVNQDPFTAQGIIQDFSFMEYGNEQNLEVLVQLLPRSRREGRPAAPRAYRLNAFHSSPYSEGFNHQVQISVIEDSVSAGRVIFQSEESSTSHFEYSDRDYLESICSEILSRDVTSEDDLVGILINAASSVVTFSCIEIQGGPLLGKPLIFQGTLRDLFFDTVS